MGSFNVVMPMPNMCLPTAIRSDILSSSLNKFLMHVTHRLIFLLTVGFLGQQ